MGRRYIAFHSDILLLQSSYGMKKVNVHAAFTERSSLPESCAVKRYAMALHHGLQVSSVYV